MIIPGSKTKFSKEIALIDDQQQLTYSELQIKVSSTIKKFRNQGVKRGMIIPIIPKQNIQEIINLLALWHISATACLLSPKIPDAQVKELIRRLPQRLKHSLHAATIMFTSGSSGEPKAVAHSIENHFYNALGSNHNIKVLPENRWLLSLPLYHVSGLSIIWRCLIAGGTIVLPKPNQEIHESIKNYSISHVSMVTTQLHRLFQNEATLKNLKSLRTILLGGGMIPEKMIKMAANYHLPVYPTYGLTEMGSQVATSSRANDRQLNILQHRKIKIGINSEILVQGKTLFLGYLFNGKIENPTDQEGWFHTGDLGAYTPKSGLRIDGRKDNMFISGGENIYPEEIENALMLTGYFKKAVIVPIKDIEFGYRPVAFVKFNRRKITFKKLTSQLRQTLPSFKIPQLYLTFPPLYIAKGIKPDRQTLFKWLNLR